MAILYRHIRLDKNEPFYIGIGKNVKRAYSYQSRNIHWKRIINLIEYEVEILFDDLTWEEACIKEQEFIKLYGRQDLGLGPLVNMTDGGEGTIGHKPSEETKKKLSESRKEKQIKPWNYKTPNVYSKKSRQKMSDMLKGKYIGNKNPNYGKPMSQANKDLISKLNKGRKQSEEEKQRRKLTLTNLVNISIDGIEYESVTNASKSLNIGITTIRRRLESKNFPTYIRLNKKEE
jgi:group I intron endonuclease